MLPFSFLLIPRSQLSELGVMARGRGLGGYQLKESATTSEATLFRMLQCIPGVSAAKAAAVIEHYHSVSELIEAYDRLPSEADKEKLLIVRMGTEVERRTNSGAIRGSGFSRSESTLVFAVFQTSWTSNRTNNVFVSNRAQRSIQPPHHARELFCGSIHILHVTLPLFHYTIHDDTSLARF